MPTGVRLSEGFGLTGPERERVAMSQKLQLTSLALTTKDGKTVTLTLDEARDLHAQLAELFGPKFAPAPLAPIIIDRERLPWGPYQPYWLASPTDAAPRWEVTCRADSGLTTSAIGMSAE